MGIPPRTFGTLQMKRRESLVTRAVVMPIQQFIHIQGISSIFLLVAAVAALAWANSPWQESYHHVWEMELTLSKLRLPVPCVDQRRPDGNLLFLGGDGN